MDDPAWALEPGALALVCDRIDAGFDTVVECGSGTSTIAIGAVLARRGAGSLHSLEHDAAWAARTRRGLEQRGSGGRVELIEAPLRPHPVAEPESGWYDTGALAALPRGIDLLLVDGPPGALAANGEARYAALPLLAPRLAPGALVVAHDPCVCRFAADFAAYDRAIRASGRLRGPWVIPVDPCGLSIAVAT
jgi:predicted O-methyltransferase YrrM